MPQASDELRAEFSKNHDLEALDYLVLHGIKPSRGCVFRLSADADYPPRVWKALQYLRDEWDYGVELT